MSTPSIWKWTLNTISPLNNDCLVIWAPSENHFYVVECDYCCYSYFVSVTLFSILLVFVRCEYTFFSAFLLNFIIGDTNFHKFIHCLFEYNILFSLSVFTETYYMWSAGNCCVFRKTHTYTSNSIDLNRRSEQKKQQNKNITLRLHWQPWNRVKHRQSDFYVHRIVRFRIELPNKICTPYE